jgi:hypothetical protein
MLPGDESRGTADLLSREGFAEFRRVMCEHSQPQEQLAPTLAAFVRRRPGAGG